MSTIFVSKRNFFAFSLTLIVAIILSLSAQSSMPASAQDVTVLGSNTPTQQADTPESLATDKPVTEPQAIQPPEEPIPAQVVIQFAVNTTEEERAAYVESVGGTIVESIESLDTVVVTLPEETAQQPLPESLVVTASEPDYYVSFLDEPAPVNDPRYPEQWAVPAIGAPSAWAELPADAPKVTVAVIDSGICASHPDLAGRIVNGWDFLESDAVPQDDFGHGCSVAGVIAANMNNDIGIAGVAPNAQIMPLRVLNTSGVGSYSDVAAAIVYAANNGAQVINLSLGGSNPSTTLENAVNYAISKEVLVVAAAGNNGTEGALYPAAYPDVIAVGSIDLNLQHSSFSNYGSQIDIWAPGRDILTTKRDNSYGLVSGTSFAAPYVVGAEAVHIGANHAFLLGGHLLWIGGPIIETPTSEILMTETPSPIIDITSTIFPTTDLVDVLERAITLRRGKPAIDQMVVTKITELNNWIFGIVAIKVPAGLELSPESYLFLAKNTEEGYQVALEFSPEILDLLEQAPQELISQNIRSTFFLSAEGDGSSSLSLPWATGERWAFVGGPHNDCFDNDNGTPSAGVWSAVDFSGGSGQVRAAQEGNVYKPCSNWLRIDHPGGWRTTYYHLVNIPNFTNGQWIPRGTYLGNTSAQAGCGGTAHGTHVHMALWKNGSHMPISGVNIGSWTVQSSGSEYNGCLVRIMDNFTVCAEESDVPTRYLYNDGNIATSTQGVIVCSEKNFEGNCETFTSTDQDVTNNHIGNDSISSLFVPGNFGWNVYFWQHSFAQGKGACLRFPAVSGDRGFSDLSSRLLWEYCNVGSISNPVIGTRAENQISSIEFQLDTCSLDLNAQCDTNPPPTQPPTTPPGTIDGLKLISVSSPTVQKGQTFPVSITYEVVSGQLLQSRGDHLFGFDPTYGAWPVQGVNGTVNPGQQVTFNFNLTAPQQTGTFESKWQLRIGGNYKGPQAIVRFAVQDTSPPPTNSGPWNSQAWQNKYLAGYTNWEGQWIWGDNYPYVYFDWGTGAPFGWGGNEFSIRLWKTIYFPGGYYTFHTRHDDGARVYIDNELFLNAWWDGSGGHDVGRNIPAGNHEVKIEYYENQGDANLNVYWYGPGFPEPDTNPPDGRITSPENNSATASSPLTIEADASDDVSGVNHVEFYANYCDDFCGWHLLDTDYSLPYSVEWDWSALTDQHVQLTTHMIDNTDKRRMDPGGYVEVDLDRTKPEVEITSPTDGDSLNGNPITITASASDNLSGVSELQFFAGYEETIGTSTQSILDLPSPATLSASGQLNAAEVSAQGWHEIGWDENGDDGWSLNWIPSEVPDQSNISIFIYAYDYAGNYQGTIHSNISLFRPAANDDFNAPKIISSIPYEDYMSTIGATQADDDPGVTDCDGSSLSPGLASIWYRYTPASNKSISIDTFGSDYDTYIAVWTGSRGSLTPITCNDDSSGGWQSSLIFEAAAGTVYHIEVAQFNGYQSLAAANTEKHKPEIQAQSGGNLEFHVSEVAKIRVDIAGSTVGYDISIPPQTSQRTGYAGVDNGPVLVDSTNGMNILAALRVIWKEPGFRASYSEMMGLPAEQLSDEYWFPWYNNAVPNSMDQGFRIGNVNATSTAIQVWVGTSMIDSFTLNPGASTRVGYNVDNGPIRIVCTDCSGSEKIIAAMRVIWKEPGVRFSYSEMMGLPKEQLSDEYWFPWYNNAVPASMDQGFRIANVSSSESNTVEVWVGTTKLDTITLGAGASTRVGYNVDNGPIRILCTSCTNTGDDKIIAALRVIWKEPGFRASYSEMMGLPKEQLSSEYWFPWYNNAVPASMDQGFRIANVSSTESNTVEVWVGTTKLDTITLGAGASTKVGYNVDNGPIRIVCTTCTNTGDDQILAALRVIWKEPGFRASYSEMMGLPAQALSTEYWFPWYNFAAPNSMDQGFRIAVP